MSIGKSELLVWIHDGLEDEYHESHQFVDGELPFQMDVHHGGRTVWTPDRKLEVIAEFGSDEERKSEANILARAEESDEKRAQLHDYGGQLMKVFPASRG